MQEKGTDNAEMGRRLKDAELVAKKAADAKGPKGAVLGDSGKGDKGPTTVKAKSEAKASQTAHDVTDELNTILKRSPSMSTTLSSVLVKPTT